MLKHAVSRLNHPQTLGENIDMDVPPKVNTGETCPLTHRDRRHWSSRQDNRRRHTGVVKKTDTQFYFWDNFGNAAPNKASGPDNIQCRILKELALEIAPVITAICRQSLELGTLPCDWKEAIICLVYKKGNVHLSSN